MLIEPSSRIEKIEAGIRFFEQDIIFSDYLFEGNLEIDMTLDYLFCGFGIVIAERYKDEPPLNSQRAHLFKLGNNNFRVIEKNVLTQTQKKENTCLMMPGPDKKNIRLEFVISPLRAVLYGYEYNTVTEKNERIELGTYKFTKPLNEYFIGFYSNKGNILRNIDYKQGVPKNWRTSISNTHGGRIKFIKNGFQFEKCVNHAEIVQDNIIVPAGKYYVSYKNKEVNGKFDIRCAVYPSSAKKMEDAEFEDEKKNIIGERGQIVLDHETPLTIKFWGHNGEISEVCIKEGYYDGFVETNDTPLERKGSYIRIDLNEIARAKWTGKITVIPEWEELLEPCPYGVVVYDDTKVKIEDIGVKLNDVCDYYFEKEKGTLTVRNGKHIVGVYKLNIRPEVRYMNIFYNVNAVITEFKIYDYAGKETDAIRQRTYHMFVPGEIEGPILVYGENDEPLDLSSSYREIAPPQDKIDMFMNDAYIELTHKPIDSDIAVYGIPETATINKDSGLIHEFASEYETIRPSNYEFDGKKKITIDDNIRKLYKHIAVSYKIAEEFTYYFTNYERELFESGGEIQLEKDAIETDIVVYGCHEKPDIDLFYRATSKEMINAIDLCSKDYEVIPLENYTYMEKSRNIILTAETMAAYPYIIVNYLKKNCYSVNYDESLKQYEVEITMTEAVAKIGYEMADNGSVEKTMVTEIKPNSNKFIVIKRKAGLFGED